MILERLVIENFRQFKGRQELNFSDLRERNITIVHAENGFGKTTLLKALLWGFYGKDALNDDFERPDSLLTESLAHAANLDPNKVFSSVQIYFKHDDARYILTRRLSLANQRLDSSKTEVILEAMKDGQTTKLETPQQRIKAILPEGISSFLFFNGERINYLAEERNSSQVTDAIQQMLGLNLLSTTIDDLKSQNVRGKLRAEQKESTSAEKRDLIDQQLKEEAELKDNENARQQTISNLNALAEEIDNIDNKLIANKKAFELQSRRIHLNEELRNISIKRDEFTKRLARLVSEDGFSIFLDGLLTRGKEIVASLRNDGHIPPPVINSFIQDLLDANNCICERHLPLGSSERKAVEALLNNAADPTFNSSVAALDHAIGLIEGIGKQTRSQIEQIYRERLQIILDIRGAEDQIYEIGQQLGGKQDEEVQQLENARKNKQIEREELNRKKGHLEARIEINKTRMLELDSLIRQIEDKEETAARAQRRINLVDECVDTLQKILAAETEALRPLLNDEIDTHFRKIMTKDYWAELTEGYTLRIRKKIRSVDGEADFTEIDAALSTGERTVTSLVFIASLVSLAKKRSEIPTILTGLSGSVFPIAIDSPFGSLSIFRDGVARYIPQLAPQVLLLVSPEQYNGQVERALNETGRVGKRYYLAYHGPTIPNSTNPELLISNQTVKQYYPNLSEEYAEIKELES